METQQLQDLLRSHLDNMPTKARRVVEYLLTHMREAAFISIGDVADRLEVSKAQMVRVARVLGFEGYADLKEALKEAVLEQVNPAARLNRVMNDENDLPDKIHQMEHANLDDTWNQLSQDKITLFCDIVKKAQNIYCTGWGISSMVAESMFSRFREMALNGILMKRGSLTLIEQARGIKPEDMVIACDLPGYAIQVTESVERAKKNGAAIVTITDSPAAPICRFADLSFYVSDNSPTFGSSLIGPIFLVHVLTSILSISLGEKAQEALEDQAQCLHDERIYHPVFGLRY
ncbi:MULTISPECIES: MurR/RpiR family transcriptional regulator [Dethiosulfovibrio]|uniref:MurR/RpiR family transcriptional regulator n=2 Tax=Dethiosulfovibrio TaxID=47054 RepID=A0ABS9EL11_9BACT|nr:MULTISPECIES: MurR/RpiR family transcriptional regulator [Dethiosulfovibrio]MCF4112905.1 MurR/RpiR family transcriptional regulator [Dethiosulfovibrio russensis]MCF4141369.1 MurR/RpiR family transcriptional regulator [Dethiosulfovibrio marinus]MCF4144324.1 MurR/RpiR family transcriptional regulator [Dethiosulfovibrio acidaminovorans]